ncbi:hypothetical protein AVEN_10684-1 [Araneus ventricosus]|uniref:Uncharacterized protein n=1 Tax=Araneus ventricosus TaxID=182803 RepID=A0A4Y2EWR8_ARAVE|nr:hypothetical protein AVEN_10684-1 [Araneus ventricosus]
MRGEAPELTALLLSKFPHYTSGRVFDTRFQIQFGPGPHTGWILGAIGFLAWSPLATRRDLATRPPQPQIYYLQLAVSIRNRFISSVELSG